MKGRKQLGCYLLGCLDLGFILDFDLICFVSDYIMHGFISYDDFGLILHIELRYVLCE